MDKPRGGATNATAFIAEWQKRYTITLHNINEDILQAMEEYAGQRREQASHPDIEQILNHVASHEITPAKAIELLQNCIPYQVGNEYWTRWIFRFVWTEFN